MYLQLLYIWCTMADMCLNSRCCCFFGSRLSVLPCHVSFLLRTLQRGVTVVVSLQIFLPIWCVFVFGLHCIHTGMSPRRTLPKLNPTVQLSCVFVKSCNVFNWTQQDNNSYTAMTLQVSELWSRKSSRKFPQPPLSPSLSFQLSVFLLYVFGTLPLRNSCLPRKKEKKNW